jgi:hypothetical protein
MAESEGDQVKKDIYGLADDEPPPAPRPAPVMPGGRAPSPPPPVGLESAKESSEGTGAVGAAAESDSAQAGSDAISAPPGVEDPPASTTARREAIKLESAATVECPKCGAPMPGDEEVVCLRCGFDLTAAQQIKIQTGVQEVEPDIPEEERKPPLTPPGRGGLHLPAILAGAALLIMTIAFLAGASGLYPTVDGKHVRGSAGVPYDAEVDFTESHPGVGRALMGVLRFYIMTAVFAGSAVAGLYVLSKMEKRKIGDSNLAALRCLAIVAICEVALLFGLDYNWGLAEWIIQFILMAGLFFTGARLFFNVNNHEAAEFGGVSMMILAMFVLIAEVIA